MGAGEDGPAAQYANRAKFGVNLAAVSDWCPQLPFADLMKQSRPWKLAPGKPLETVDEKGYPTAIDKDARPYATCLLDNKYYPAGVYVLTWKGKATLSVPEFDVVAVLKSEPGRLELQVKPNAGLKVRIDEMDPADPLRDVHFWLPGHEGQLFNRAFLDYVTAFGTIRFMDWMRTNGSTQRVWQDRPKPDHCTWRPKVHSGVPIEVMVELCNEIKADGWFCMPHQADDDYVRAFAVYVRDHLDPDLKAYVEYSNEHFNWSFSVSRYCLKLGEEMGYKEGKGPHHAYYSKRSKEIFAIWHEVFGDEKTRVVRTLGGWASMDRSNEMILRYAGRGSADAFAIAPYFYLGKKIQEGANGKLDSVEKVLEEVRKVVGEDTPRIIAAARKRADEYGVRLICYEAGQHLISREERRSRKPGPMTKLFMAANRDPGMGPIYTTYLHSWFANSNDLICLYNSVSRPNLYGSWGMKEYLAQPLDEAPKYKAIIQAIEDPRFIKKQSIGSLHDH
jgi:hypothetical protein